MSIFSFFSNKPVETVEAVGNVLGDLFTSDDERLTHEEVKTRLYQKPQMAQAEINKVQATHSSTLVAGARPFLMWVCGVGMGMAFIVNPLLEFFTPGTETIKVPLEQMTELTLAMLGLAAYRTVEKIKGVAK